MNMFAGSLLADLATKGLFVTITAGIATSFWVVLGGAPIHFNHFLG